MMYKCIKPGILFVILMLPVVMSSAQGGKIQLKAQNTVCGADQPEAYFDLLNGKNVGLVGNKSSVSGGVHLLDVLLREGVAVQSVFCPEHGFRGEGEAGELIANHLDPATGIPVISIYGSTKKPSADDLAGIDILVFDIQDVGARFYTYISTLHYIMEAAAENHVAVLVLDRPNPNGFYIDGPVREEPFSSFVGMHPVPVLHGMTVGEYARMINGEGWLKDRLTCDLQVIPCLHYDHLTEYILPVTPSPNLPNQTAVYLYPTLCFFEGTVVSVGRGTQVPFQVYGHPKMDGDFFFRPVSIPGASLHPKWENQLCSGFDLREKGVTQLFNDPRLHLEWIIQAYNLLGKPDDFFTPYFDTLAGTDQIRKGIIEGKTALEISQQWQEGLIEYQTMRKNYLLY